ncbi:MAG: hypothetical protein KF892_03755 [Rhizobacter sp.]|nr:hypothetical protein [Rhizobacter sp.]
MKLALHEIQRLAAIEERFDRLKTQFDKFVGDLQFFSSTECPVKGVLVTPAVDGLSLTATFTTVRIEMTFQLQPITPSGGAKGRVVVRQLPRVGCAGEPTQLGSFTFTPSGDTDIEYENSDAAVMNANAEDILASFLNQAIQQPLGS